MEITILFFLSSWMVSTHFGLQFTPDSYSCEFRFELRDLVVSWNGLNVGLTVGEVVKIVMVLTSCVVAEL